MITKEILLKIAPRAKDADALVKALNTYMPKFGIDKKEEIAMFIAQCCHESAGFSTYQENLNYSADGLMKTWPKRFPTRAIATTYMRKPEKIANKVYADRMCNGNEASGDGWRYRGRGIKQLTGKYNYQIFEKDTGIKVVANPDILLQPTEAVISACWFWQKNKLDPHAMAKDVLKVTKIINGGTLGLKERKALFDKLMSIL